MSARTVISSERYQDGTDGASVLVESDYIVQSETENVGTINIMHHPNGGTLITVKVDRFALWGGGKISNHAVGALVRGFAPGAKYQRPDNGFVYGDGFTIERHYYV